MQQPSDPFGIRAGSRFVMQRARDVRIDDRKAYEIAHQIIDQTTSGGASTWQQDHLQELDLSDEDLAMFVLVLDALNFYFWGDPRWRVSERGQTENGYWALTMALRRAIREGYPITDAVYLSEISSTNVAHILRGESVIPMFPARVQNLREAGAALLREHDGRFLSCIKGSNRSGTELMRQIITLFPSFVDVRTYAGRTIPFYKRAQILVSDLSGAFESRGQACVDDIASLTAFADYKVPQVLQQLGVLRYSSALERSLRQMELIPVDHPWEVEIRAATIVAVELIALETTRAGAALPDYAVDWHLWDLGQADVGARLPYHRTPTSAY